MTKELVTYKKINTYFYKRRYSNRCKTRDICPICKKLILTGDHLYLLINNYKLFPNVFVHQNCITTKKECVIELTKSYKKYEDFKDKYIFWEPKEY